VMPNCGGVPSTHLFLWAVGGSFSPRRRLERKIGRLAQAFLVSRVFTLRPLYPHFLHLVARIAFLALQFMQTFLIRFRASASGNLAIWRPLAPQMGSLYLTVAQSKTAQPERSPQLPSLVREVREQRLDLDPVARARDEPELSLAHPVYEPYLGVLADGEVEDCAMDSVDYVLA